MSNIEFNRRDLIIRQNPIPGFKFNANYDVIIDDVITLITRASPKKGQGFYCEIGNKTVSLR